MSRAEPPEGERAQGQVGGGVWEGGVHVSLGEETLQAEWEGSGAESRKVKMAMLHS